MVTLCLDHKEKKYVVTCIRLLNNPEYFAKPEVIILDTSDFGNKRDSYCHE